MIIRRNLKTEFPVHKMLHSILDKNVFNAKLSLIWKAKLVKNVKAKIIMTPRLIHVKCKKSQ